MWPTFAFEMATEKLRRCQFAVKTEAEVREAIIVHFSSQVRGKNKRYENEEGQMLRWELYSRHTKRYFEAFSISLCAATMALYLNICNADMKHFTTLQRNQAVRLV